MDGLRPPAADTHFRELLNNAQRLPVIRREKPWR